MAKYIGCKKINQDKRNNSNIWKKFKVIADIIQEYYNMSICQE